LIAQDCLIICAFLYGYQFQKRSVHRYGFALINNNPRSKNKRLESKENQRTMSLSSCSGDSAMILRGARLAFLLATGVAGDESTLAIDSLPLFFGLIKLFAESLDDLTTCSRAFVVFTIFCALLK
jgi:hypothetical protein